MLNTFKNIIQMPEGFRFMNPGPWGFSGKKIHVSRFVEGRAANTAANIPFSKAV